jgi:hypothetical protein
MMLELDEQALDLGEHCVVCVKYYRYFMVLPQTPRGHYLSILPVICLGQCPLDLARITIP